MPITQVQKKEFASGNSLNHSITLDSTPTQGNLIILFFCGDVSITSPPAGYHLAVAGAAFIAGFIYYKIAAAGESATISVSVNNSTSLAMQAFEYSGMSTTPLDRWSKQTPTGSGTSVVSGTTDTTRHADELIMVSANMRSDEVPSQSVTSWDNSFTIENEIVSPGTVGSLLNVASRIVSATGTYSSTGTITAGGVAQDVGLIVTFKQADPPSVASGAWFIA